MPMSSSTHDLNEVTLRGTLVKVTGAGTSEVRFAVQVHSDDTGRHLIDCVVQSSRAIATIERAEPGSRLAISGWITRRYWRTSAGVASRTVVEVSSLRLHRAASR